MPGADTGTLSGWLGLGVLGIAVDVIDARQAHAVMRLQHNKTDANDAELLAEVARSGFCRPVSMKSASAQEGRVLLKSRPHLVRQRRDTQNAIRGLLASLGLRFPRGAGKLAARVRAALATIPSCARRSRRCCPRSRGWKPRSRSWTRRSRRGPRTTRPAAC